MYLPVVYMRRLKSNIRVPKLVAPRKWGSGDDSGKVISRLSTHYISQLTPHLDRKQFLYRKTSLFSSRALRKLKKKHQKDPSDGGTTENKERGTSPDYTLGSILIFREVRRYHKSKVCTI